ncbi:gliding motility-associated C-terminal domain-containing protein [Flavobacterium sp.]|uniref:gliding motility-associated C-terminal domain-containing protein n=1 Tax=Flavobacterium sp. TaxID=239 RepID=UPI002637CF94|nr:gliding motility-associated C-terminal domain-containing protein [Flavobacterium sp.]
MKKTTSRLKLSGLLQALMLMLCLSATAQIYQHDFGATPITSYPYTVAPTVSSPDISNSAWTNNLGIWVSYTGQSGQALGHPAATAGATMTLTFDVAPGKELSIASYNFWRQRSPVGPQNWSMAINGIAVGTGTVPSTGAAIGTTAVTNAVTGLTGTVTVVLTLTNPLGSGSFALDNFTLSGTVTDACVPPTVTSISPASGPAETVVAINGSGFTTGTGTTAVSFNGITAAGFTVVSNELIKAVVPHNATAGPITITTNGCEADTSSFTILASDCPDLGNSTEVFISELYDHTPGSYGMIELYNPTPNTITFNGQYVLERYGTIGDVAPSNTLTLPGSIAPFSTYLVISNTGDSPGCTNTPQASINTGINANDEFRIRKNGVVIDIARAPNNTGYTVIRTPTAEAPTSVYSGTDWTFTPNDCANLGIHNIQLSNVIVQQPESQSVCEGEEAVFTVQISNPTGFTYQWKTLNASGVWVNVTDGSDFSGATTNTLTVIDAMMSLNGSQYYCEIESASCRLISDAAQLTVSPLPVAVVIPTAPTCTPNSGSIQITASIGDDLTFSLNGTDFSANTTITGLNPGTYTLYIQSSAGCLSTMPVIVPPSPLAPDIAVTTIIQPNCTDASGSIEITSPIETGLEYSINGTDFQASPLFENLTEGTYTVTVQNALGCISVTAPIVINEAPVIPDVATTVVTQPTCTTSGIIEVTAPVGAGYTYSVDGMDFQATTTFSGLAPGTYTIIVSHIDGCTSETADIIINPAPAGPAVATTTVTQATCTTGGSITVTAPLGAGLEYSINGTDFQTGTTFNNVVAGTYTVTVQNPDGCTSETADIVIDPAPNAPAVATTTVTQPNCTTTTGTIQVTAPLGAGLEYSINGTDFQMGTTFSGLAAGTYTVTVMNADGCISETTDIILTPVSTPAVATTTVTQPTCTTASIIEVTAPLGAGLEYSINGTDFQTGTTFSGLTQGTYTVTVQNAEGCTSVTANITINAAPATPAVATTTVTQPTCTTAGIIEVTAPLGTGLEYSINGTDFQTGTTFSGLTQGTYTVTVQNVDGCTSVTANITIDATPTAPAVATTTVTQPTCTTAGIIEVTAPLGAGLEYSINGTDFQTGTTFSGLTEGSYTITVQNAGGCTSVTDAIIINEAPVLPDAPVVTITNPACGETSGIIEVTSPVGATTMYSINGTDFQLSNIFNVAPGTYTVTVMISMNCTASTSGIVVEPAPTTPDMAAVTVTQPTCTTAGIIEVTAPTGAGLTYSIDGTTFQSATTFSGLTPGQTYTVTVQNAGGCTSVTSDIVIDNIPAGPAVAVTTVTQPTCAVATGTIEITAPIDPSFTYSIDGTTFQSGTLFTGLAPDIYTVTVRNADGCTSTADVIIDEPTGAEVATYLETQPTCTITTGMIEVIAPAGAGFSYSLDGGTTYQPTRFFDNLAPGSYTITVQNPDGCTSETEIIIIDEIPTPPVVTGVQGCTETTFGTTYLLETTVTGSASDIVSYTWRRGNNVVGSEETFDASAYALNNNIDASQYPLEFTVTVINAAGCEATYTFSVEHTFCMIPRGISPNNDGDNDTFDLTGLGATKVTIFNRYGKEVYSRSNYINEWMGQSDNGDELPTGTYFYVVETASDSKTGWVYVNRQQ